MDRLTGFAAGQPTQELTVWSGRVLCEVFYGGVGFGPGGFKA